jgi:hypothetical protein
MICSGSTPPRDRIWSTSGLIAEHERSGISRDIVDRFVQAQHSTAILRSVNPAASKASLIGSMW